MSIFKTYREFVKDNPHGYWFKRRWYGYGWTPVKWQGWAVLLVYVLAITTFAFTIDENSSGKEIIFTFLLPVILLTVTLLRICYNRGEKPRWQWGPPKK